MDEQVKTQVEQALDTFKGIAELSFAVQSLIKLNKLNYVKNGWVIYLRCPIPLAPLTKQSLTQAYTTHFNAQLPYVVEVILECKVPYYQVQGELKPKSKIKNIIAVGSGKGGVGKTTVAVHLALALQKQGAKVGILDADIYGPSQALIFQTTDKPLVVEKKIIPPQHQGIPVMSMGYLIELETPMIWRGPMVSSALQQLLNDTQWPELDYLIVDLPPGTGDIQLTMAQKIPLSGAVIVTTPQDLSLLDATKALKMFQKVEVAVLGVVENMSYYLCPQCGHSAALFGQGGGKTLAERFALPLLAQLPLNAQLQANTDAGKVFDNLAIDSLLRPGFMHLAEQMCLTLAQQPINYTAGIPQIRTQT
jgi:ATP-binding protein involved in chromosome partitioning